MLEIESKRISQEIRGGVEKHCIFSVRRVLKNMQYINI